MPKLKPEELLAKITERLAIPKEKIDKVLAGEAEFEEVNNHIEENFVSYVELPVKDKAVQILQGKILGATEAKLRQAGLPFKKDQKLVDAVTEHIGDYKTKIETLTVELAAAKEGGKPDKAIEDLTKKLDAEVKKAGNFETQLTNLRTEYDTYKTQQNDIQDRMLLNEKVRALKSQIKLVDNPDQYKLTGADAIINSAFKFGLNENKTDIVVTDVNGNPVMNATKTKNLTPFEILEGEYKKAGLVKQNNLPAGSPAPATPAFVPPASSKTRTLPAAAALKVAQLQEEKKAAI